MKVNKIKHCLLSVIVLVSLGAGEKSVKANTISNDTNLYSLADIKLEKELKANKAWELYIEYRKDLMFFEKHFSRLLEYNVKIGKNIGKYSLKKSNVLSENDKLVAEQLLNLINGGTKQYGEAIKLQQEADKYQNRLKNFS